METGVMSFILQLYLTIIQKLVAHSLELVNSALTDLIKNILGTAQNQEGAMSVSKLEENKSNNWV